MSVFYGSLKTSHNRTVNHDQNRMQVEILLKTWGVVVEATREGASINLQVYQTGGTQINNNEKHLLWRCDDTIEEGI